MDIRTSIGDAPDDAEGETSNVRSNGAWRRHAGHTRGAGHLQERLALTAGIDRSYFSAIERGEFNVTLGVLLKVASALGVPAWKLLKRAKL